MEQVLKNMDYPKAYLYRRIVQSKLFIDKNYMKNIDVSNISDEANFSKFHFIRLFKQAFNKTSHQYLTFVRIEKAKALLQSNKSITDTCFLVGFESVSSFSGLFKKHVGITPSDFLKQCKKRKEKVKRAPLSFIPGCFITNYGWDK